MRGGGKRGGKLLPASIGTGGGGELTGGVEPKINGHCENRRKERGKSFQLNGFDLCNWKLCTGILRREIYLLLTENQGKGGGEIWENSNREIRQTGCWGFSSAQTFEA